MIAILGRIALGMILMVGAAFAGGVRFHPEVISEHFLGSQDVYREINMTNGKKVVGKLINEDEKGLTVEMGGGNVVLVKSEIASNREIPAEDIEAGLYSEWMVESPKVPVFSYKDADNLFMKLPMFKSEETRQVSSVGSPVTPLVGSSPDLSPEAQIQKMLEQHFGTESAEPEFVPEPYQEADSYQQMLEDTSSPGLVGPKFSGPKISNSLTASTKKRKTSSSTYTSTSGGTTSATGGGYNGGKYGSDYMEIVNRAMSPEAMMAQAQQDIAAMNATRNPMVECMKYGNCGDK